MGSHSAPNGPAGKAQRRELAEARRRRRLGPGGIWLFVLSWTGTVLSVVRAGIATHATVGFYLVALLLLALLPPPAVAATAIADQLSARALPRPRWLYGVLAVAFATPAAIFAAFGVRLHGQSAPWWTGTAIERGIAVAASFCVGWCAFLFLVMLGRAVTWGGFRRRFWISPPAWLGDRVSQ